MIIEKYGIVQISNKGIEISGFTFNCEGNNAPILTVTRRALYFAMGVINRELKLLEGDFEDYFP